MDQDEEKRNTLEKWSDQDDEIDDVAFKSDQDEIDYMYEVWWRIAINEEYGLKKIYKETKKQMTKDQLKKLESKKLFYSAAFNVPLRISQEFDTNPKYRDDNVTD